MALCGELGACPLPSEALDNVRPGHRLERDIKAYVPTAPVGDQRVGITARQRAQQDPLTSDRVSRTQRLRKTRNHVGRPGTWAPLAAALSRVSGGGPLVLGSGKVSSTCWPSASRKYPRKVTPSSCASKRAMRTPAGS